MTQKIITVFGSSIPRPGEEEYRFAYELGKRLGAEGYSVCTGGYSGIMEGVSKGATETGGEAIGITVGIFKGRPNPFLTKNIECVSLMKRIEKLVELGEAYIVLRGGTGTLLELAMVWELINKNLIPEKEIICHGEMWKRVTTPMEERITIEKRKTGLVSHAQNIDEIIRMINRKLKV